MNKFKLNDYVKIKSSGLAEEMLLQDKENFYGKIIDIVETDTRKKLYLIKFDADSLLKLPEEYIVNSIDNGNVYTEYFLFEEDITKTKRQDSDEQYKKALKIVHNIEDKHWEDEITTKIHSDREMTNKLIGKFINTNYYNELDNSEKEDAESIISIFDELLIYECETNLENFLLSDLKIISLDILPRKVVDEKEFFKSFSNVLIQFFYFLQEERILDNANEFVEFLKKNANLIVSKSQDKTNFGSGKDIITMAQNAGVDFENEEEMELFISEYNQEMEKLATPIVKQDKINRNQKVSVKYTNGKIIENIKYKKVIKDIENQKCELI